MKKKPAYLAILLALPFLMASQTQCSRPAPSLNSPIWPKWVHEHWVWENVGTETSAAELVHDYRKHNIPVGALIIDRPWETDSNTLIPDPKRYPNLGDLVKEMHSIDVHVFMWITSIINETASNHQEAKNNGYFIKDGETVSWWGGKGSLIDYNNPKAVEWWHRQLDPIIDMGIDGWKVDATDPTLIGLYPWWQLPTAIGAWREYKAATYRDFFEYIRKSLGNDRVITARPTDDFIGFGLPFTFAPRDVNFAGWVGDQDGTFGGLQHAIRSMAASANEGYVSYGSDIGGFRGEGMRDRELLIRWAQLGALSTIMENGGSGEHRPWMYDQEIEDIYRKYTILHHELIPYIYSQAAYAYERGVSTYQNFNVTDNWSYMLGDSIFVAPLTHKGGAKGTDRNITFPPGEWIDFFDESGSYSEGEQLLTFSLDRYPVYVKKGSILAMDIRDNSTGHGSSISEGHTTILVYPGDQKEVSAPLYEEKERGSIQSYRKTATGLELSSAPTQRALLFRIVGWKTPQEISSTIGGGHSKTIPKVERVEDLESAPIGWAQETRGKTTITWIRVQDASAGIGLQLN